MMLREPRENELEALSRLCLRSKAMWGYDEAFMEACVEELTVRQEALAAGDLQVVEVDDALAAIAEISCDGASGCLEKMFVDPRHIGGGVGRILFEWATRRLAARGATVMMIEADPGAAPFYRRMGAVDAGEAPSGSIPGRMLPLLGYDLASPPSAD